MGYSDVSDHLLGRRDRIKDDKNRVIACSLQIAKKKTFKKCPPLIWL